MNDGYEVLAKYYDPLGLNRFALNTAPQIVNFAHGLDWVGRKVVDIGCGTGGSVRWFASQGYNITGIDVSPSMLATAKRSLDGRGVALQWIQGDASALEPIHDVEMVTALDVINEMTNLRELENFFTAVSRGIEAGKLFVFDIHTLEGLADDSGQTHILRHDEDFSAFVTGEFEHERQTRTDTFLLFRHEGGHWIRDEASHSRRGFPLQVVISLLGRTGFQVRALVNTNFEAIQQTAPGCPRAICFAMR